MKIGNNDGTINTSTRDNIEKLTWPGIKFETSEIMKTTSHSTTEVVKIMFGALYKSHGGSKEYFENNIILTRVKITWLLYLLD